MRNAAHRVAGGHFTKAGSRAFGQREVIAVRVGHHHGLDRSAVRGSAPIAFFENLMPNMPSVAFSPGLTPTQAFYVYSTLFAPDWANALYLLDFDPHVFGS